MLTHLLLIIMYPLLNIVLIYKMYEKVLTYNNVQAPE